MTSSVLFDTLLDLRLRDDEPLVDAAGDARVSQALEAHGIPKGRRSATYLKNVCEAVETEIARVENETVAAAITKELETGGWPWLKKNYPKAAATVEDKVITIYLKGNNANVLSE